MEHTMIPAAEKEAETKESKSFIERFIDEDLETGRFDTVQTRFPPEPNGYLHLGHAKAIVVDFGIAEKYRGSCNLRFDDTNPEKEDTEYVDSIMEDIRWLGFSWQNVFYTSDYFPRLYELAEDLIKRGLAYVCDLSGDEVRSYRGTLTQAGKESPYRNRSVEENLSLFRRMKAGEFADGSKTLRAKIDMASPNLNMRDPVIYRIQHASHHRTGDTWCIYPMYDFAHPLSDSLEGVTFSLCTMEFEAHRPLYDWLIDALAMKVKSRQIEFARLNVNYSVMSKRKMKKLVEDHIVDGWNDPRLLTLSGMRRRGYPAAAIRAFCDSVGVAKANSVVDMAQLEHFVRDNLNYTAPRRMAVLNPLKVVLTNYPDGQTEVFDAVNNPEEEAEGTRPLIFGKVVYIEKSDFMENPPKKFHRLSPGAEMRLQHAYYIKCEEVIKDESGEIVELRCTYDPESRGGWAKDGRKVKGTAHWVADCGAVDGEVRLYDRLFAKEDPEDGDFGDNLNPNSLKIVRGAKLEKSLDAAEKGERFQFLRNGYFVADGKNESGLPVFNRIVSLKDGFKKGN
ncbi:MAG TPA: glutamine--tRNA ligase/YqeY domain fusion protein [Clostridiales bacterium]|nr:glutamine--tRNA ligase/YqeY domain fusion protein [Clostridiales bacterium]